VRRWIASDAPTCSGQTRPENLTLRPVASLRLLTRSEMDGLTPTLVIRLVVAPWRV
jgi:hypothetical protein